MVRCPDERHGGDRGAGISGGVYGGVCLDGGVRDMAEVLPKSVENNPDLSEWSGILFPEEKILWQGQPFSGVKLRGYDFYAVIFGSFFTCFALFWMTQAARAGGYFWMFGLIHFCVGLSITLAPFLYQPFLRRRTHYTLTNERAFVATNLPMVGRKLSSYPINKSTPISFEDGDFATINFATRQKWGQRGNVAVPTGFELISGGRGVYSLFRQIQSEAK